jgi:hypothetical protein
MTTCRREPKGGSFTASSDLLVDRDGTEIKKPVDRSRMDRRQGKEGFRLQVSIRMTRRRAPLDSFPSQHVTQNF